MLLSRYRAGLRTQVWDEVRRLGPTVRNLDVFSEAYAVARETMERARHNVALLAQRLSELGYQFADPKNAHVPPSGDEPRLIAEIEELIGPLPLSFRAFHEVVGSVNFCQSLDQLVHWWPEERRAKASELEVLGEEDPLFVLPLASLHQDLMAARASDRKRGNYARYGWREVGKERWYCWLAPDEFHKANYSGGEDYNLFIPDPGADFRIRDLFLGVSDEPEEDREWFVDHLRKVFESGGFRGKNDEHSHRKRPVRLSFIPRLTQGLLGI
jgi:hypothetical protein